MHLFDHGLGRFAGKDLLQHVCRRSLRQSAVLAALHVEALDFCLRCPCLVHQECSILFLLKQKHALEHAINVNFQKPIPLVDCATELVADLDGRLIVYTTRVDHDTVRIAVNHVERHAFGQLAGGRQDFSAFEGRECCERSCVEPRVLIAKTAIHTVSRELERLLLDVPLQLFQRWSVLVFHECLDLPPPIHKRRNEVRQYTLGHIRRRHIRDIVAVLVGMALDSRKVNVVFLNDAGVQRVEVHHQDVLVPESPLRLKDKTAFELFLLSAPFFLLRCLLVPHRLLVGAYVLFLVELMQQNVLVALCTAAVQCAGPGVAGQVR